MSFTARKSEGGNDALTPLLGSTLGLTGREKNNPADYAVQAVFIGGEQIRLPASAKEKVMKFVQQISEEAAGKIIDRIEYAATRGNLACDVVEFSGAGGRVQLSPYSTNLQRPREFSKVVAGSYSSSLELVRMGNGWRLTFEGKRGSLRSHWGIVEMLQKDNGKILEYATSVPGMEPWEDLYSWFCRLLGEPGAYLHPFDAVNGAGEADNFNRRFHAAIKELAAKGKLDGGHLKVYCDLIVADIKREYRW